MVTVITHGDVINQMPNVDEARENIISQARKATKSYENLTFVVHNWTENVDQLDEDAMKEVLKMLHTALECGERSVKMRQTKRKQMEMKRSRQRGTTESEKAQNPINKNYKYKYNNL